MEFVTFFLKQHNRMFALLGQHMAIVALSLSIAACIALPLGYFLSRTRWISVAVIGAFSTIYAIPSIALLVLLVPVTGLGMRTAVVVISIYAQFILLRNVVISFQTVDPAVLEASRGMGLSALEILLRIELPLTAPSLISGFRVATLSSISVATIAATINSGGIGILMLEGVRNLHMVKLVWGILLASALSLTANQLLTRAETRFSDRARGLDRRKQKNVSQEIYDASL
ncbi:MAG: ABC transporter permease [Synergistaceae bacterium]|jgi:osmoprotectant transport system permease protein|nr:ABC transporter permease [Synergistaceae bacterium]